jgi:tetratricopeptide (TPR) repeat protein
MMAISLDSLRKAVKKNKGRSQALAWLADMERASGDYEAALKIVDTALAASPSDVPAMLVRAKVLAGQQDYAGSISQYKKVLAKDPFCLSAHKRMGESYDKLGKVAERNACFRRVHDMDPLDPFWKEEYDVLPEEEQASLVPPPMDESSFTMDVNDDAENAEISGEDNIFANLAASLPNTDEEDNSSMEALRNSLNFASDNLSKNPDGSEIPDFDHVLNSSEVSSAISGILGGDDDLDVVDSGKKAVAEEEPATSSLFSHFSDDEKVDEEESKQESVSDELIDEPLEKISEEKLDDSELSLDSLDEPLDADKKSTNVDDAFSSLLGDDELPEESTADTSSSSELNEEKPLEESLDAPEENSTEKENLVGESSESGIPTSHMDFSDEADAVESDDLNLDEKPEEVAPKTEDAGTNVDDAFSSLLGDDELPEEQASVAPESDENSFGSLFEKSADADFNMNDDVSTETTGSVAAASDEKAPETEPLEKPASGESLGGLFEKSADADFSMDKDTLADTATDDVVEKAPEFTPTEAAENIAPAEGLVPTSHMDFSDEEDLSKPEDDFVLNLDESSESEKKDEESAAEDVDGAFDALFGDDEAPVENAPAEEPVAEESVAEQPKEESLAQEMGGAFASMFGDKDDSSLAESAPSSENSVEETPAEESLSQEATSAELEESAVKENVEKGVEESFDSIFGKDDDLNLPEEPVAAPVAEQAVEETAPSAELDSIDSEVSNAFKGLFDEDDSLPESDEPNNNGVDYLMSGDSDDEVSASLVANAEAPLSRGAADLDDSLNTRTLADIYMEQGVYDKALDIYSDLAKKNPDNAEIQSRLEEVKKLCREKFGEV